jgi:hypothetical protein
MCLKAVVVGPYKGKTEDEGDGCRECFEKRQGIQGDKSMVNENGGCCCVQFKGVTKITFADGDQVAIVGLDEVLATISAENMPANDDTAEIMIARLVMKNYIPSSEDARREYRYALLKAYREHMKRQVEDNSA